MDRFFGQEERVSNCSGWWCGCAVHDDPHLILVPDRDVRAAERIYSGASIAMGRAQIGTGVRHLVDALLCF